MTADSDHLKSIPSDDDRGAGDLFPLVYEELRRLAELHIFRERPDQSLNATALVNEAWLRLVGDKGPPNWVNREYFFGAAATAMRRILVERARRRLRIRHGGEFSRQFVELDQLPNDIADEDILAVHEALEALAQHDAAKARLVELRFFAGMTLPEAAAALGISTSTADRSWKYARAWLYTAMNNDREENFPSDLT